MRGHDERVLPRHVSHVLEPVQIPAACAEIVDKKVAGFLHRYFHPRDESDSEFFSVVGKFAGPDVEVVTSDGENFIPQSGGLGNQPLCGV